MTIAVTMYDTVTLLGVYRWFIDSKTYWLDSFYNDEIHSEDEYIDFSKISDVRRIAPFVAPLAQGKPIFTDAGTVTRFKPSYSKMKDPVGPTRGLKLRPGQIGSPIGSGGTMLSRWNTLVADIARTHKEALTRLWEWMAARATIDASITIYGEAMPERTIMFGRDAGQTVTLTGGARWGQSGVSIVGNLATWGGMMRIAQFGGPPTRVTIGANVWEVMRVDPEIRALQSTQVTVRNAPNIDLGPRQYIPGVEYVGSISPTVDLYVYNDYYHAYDGTVTPYMNANDIVITGPNVNGVRCFGAILDPRAGFQPLSLWPTMWMENDPPAAMIMTQSAPLMVPINPNNTFKATVLGPS